MAGIVRKIDSLGRITIPKTIRDAFDIEGESVVKFYVEGDAIVISTDLDSQSFISVRKFDDLGRVTIPKELRESLNLRIGGRMQIIVENGSLKIKPYLADGDILMAFNGIKNAVNNSSLSCKDKLTELISDAQDIIKESEGR